MKCEVCGQGTEQGVSLYRQNEKGVTGIWRCVQHNQVIDEELHEIVAILEQPKPADKH